MLIYQALCSCESTRILKYNLEHEGGGMGEGGGKGKEEHGGGRERKRMQKKKRVNRKEWDLSHVPAVFFCSDEMLRLRHF